MVDDLTGNGTYKINDILITNPGTNYTLAPLLTPLGGNPTVAATIGAPALAMNDVTGGLTKQGAGTLTLTGDLTYGGTTLVSGGTLQINTSSVPVSLAAIMGSDLGVGDGTNVTSLTATSVAMSTLSVKQNSILTIGAIAGGPQGGSVLSPVPEPSTITLLVLAGLGLLIAARRKRR